jgi:hypothetical protein
MRWHVKYRVAKYAGRTAADRGYLSGCGCSGRMLVMILTIWVGAYAIVALVAPTPLGSWLADLSAGVSRDQCLNPAWGQDLDNFDRHQKCLIRAYVACTPFGKEKPDTACLDVWFEGYPRPAW